MKKLTLILSMLLSLISCDDYSLSQPSVNKECNFIIPKEWKLSQNKNGKWAIINNVGGLLGYSVRYHTYDFGSYDGSTAMVFDDSYDGSTAMVFDDSYDGSTAMVFDDSCSAKGLAKQYLDFIDKNKFQ